MAINGHLTAAPKLESEGVILFEEQLAYFHKSLNDCLTEEAFCDIVLVSELDGKRVNAHRIILSAASEYFKTMLTGSLLESNEKEIFMEVPGDILEMLVGFFYSGKLTPSMETALDLYATAHCWRLNAVVQTYSSFVLKHLSPDNCFSVMNFAEAGNYEELLDGALKYITENFGRVCLGVEFLKLTFVLLFDILGHLKLKVQEEKLFFDAIIRWISHDAANRGQHFDELLGLVHLSKPKLEYLIDTVKPFCKTVKNLHCYVLALEQHIVPHRFKNAITDRPRSNEDSLLIIGSDKSSESLLGIIALHPKTNKWRKVTTKLPLLKEFSAVALDSQLYIVGIQDTAISLDIYTRNLNTLPSMQQERAHCGATLLNGVLYVTGGKVSSHCNSVIECWYPSDRRWSVIQRPKPLSWYDYSLPLTGMKGKLYSVEAPTSTNIKIMSIDKSSTNQSWSCVTVISLKPVAVAVSGGQVTKSPHVSICSADENLYVAVGVESFCYNIKDETLTKLTDMPYDIDVTGSTIYRNKLIVVGLDSRILELDLITNKWTELVSLKKNQHKCCVVTKAHNFNWRKSTFAELS